MRRRGCVRPRRLLQFRAVLLFRSAALFLAVSLAAHASGARTSVASAAKKIVLYQAAVYTLDPARPRASAVVVENGRIAYVGDDAGARAFAGPGARSIPLPGRMILPGFHDSRLHPMTGGMRLLR